MNISAVKTNTAIVNTLVQEIGLVMTVAADYNGQLKPMINSLCQQLQLADSATVCEAFNDLAEITDKSPEQTGMQACWQTVRKYIRDYYAGQKLTLKLTQKAGIYIRAEWFDKSPKQAIQPKPAPESAPESAPEPARENGCDAVSGHTKALPEKLRIALDSIACSKLQAIQILLADCNEAELLQALEFGADLAVLDLETQSDAA